MAQPATNCSSCGSPLELGQQYCVTCGVRSGPRRDEVRRLMDNAGGRAAPPVPLATRAAARGPLAALGSLRLPSRLVAASLLIVFLGTGVALGEVARHSALDALAAAQRRPLNVLIASHGKPKPAEQAPAEE